MRNNQLIPFYETTILSVRKGNQVVMVGDGQIIMGNLILKSNVRKVRRLGNGDVIAGFSGSIIDALTLFDRLEAKLEQNPHQLINICVDLAMDWHKDPLLSHLDAMMAVVNKTHSLILTGTGEILEPEDGLICIGSGSSYALSAARALLNIEGLSARIIAEKSMDVYSEIYNFKNKSFIFEIIDI
ncbi:MAG: ATP-dependent protease subunit HslV [Alphaproteobacteria bacterium]|nr:ATP-dependent protease subunit HslV [Alphaproteobacteria bacterium]